MRLSQGLELHSGQVLLSDLSQVRGRADGSRQSESARRDGEPQPLAGGQQALGCHGHCVGHGRWSLVVEG